MASFASLSSFSLTSMESSKASSLAVTPISYGFSIPDGVSIMVIVFKSLALEESEGLVGLEGADGINSNSAVIVKLRIVQEQKDKRNE